MILVVDNDSSFLELASKTLNRDRQVLLASNAEQAFELAKQVGLSVVLIDLDMKGKAGLLLIQQLRETLPDLAIIAISTTLNNSTLLEEAQKLGIAEILQKPITPEWKPVVERVRATVRRAG
ncbi:MAG TPA: response regulator [Bryobacteraceae bacterium]|nr:response regulator [Bryobacteraceae bacterium]